MQVVLYEDGSERTFGPLTLLRPAFDLRCGRFTLLEKLERGRPDWRVALVARPGLRDVVALEHPGRGVDSLDDGPTVLLSATTVVDDELLDRLGDLSADSLLRDGERVVGAYVTSGARALAGSRGSPDLASLGLPVAKGVSPRTVRYPWDLVAETASEIALDARLVDGRGEVRGELHERACLISPEGVTVGQGSAVGPGVVLDASAGDVLIGRDVRIMPNAVITGPVSIGDGSLVKPGARLSGGTSVGPVCKVGGEVSASVLQSHSNKQHDGYLGNSFVGSWVNLGAGTDTSDLRNDYAKVRVEIGGSVVETGSLSVGAVIGDHSKTAIGTKLNTGSVVGAFCNVFPGQFPPKSIPSFSWGTSGGFVRYDRERAIDTARRVMARRGVELSRAREALIRSVYEGA
ncbi:MAG: putative sugar nucleotidyl transferase [Candidatus Eisenbacteria bacterium]